MSLRSVSPVAMVIEVPAGAPAREISRERRISSSRDGGGGGTDGGGGLGDSVYGCGRGMKRSFSPIFHVYSSGTTVEVAGTAVDSVSDASTQSSPVSWLTCPAKLICTCPLSGASWMS
jgi:hypothetical protein